jgi:hypothetical protein
MYTLYVYAALNISIMMQMENNYSLSSNYL